MWYNNPDIFLAIHKGRRETVASIERRNLRLIRKPE